MPSVLREKSSQLLRQETWPNNDPQARKNFLRLALGRNEDRKSSHCSRSHAVESDKVNGDRVDGTHSELCRDPSCVVDRTERRLNHTRKMDLGPSAEPSYTIILLVDTYCSWH
jgi:hypothetical protein